MAGTPAEIMDQPQTMQSDSFDIEAAKQDLQALWIKYLGFLDQYSKAQQEIGTYHSSGTFSLAEANFKNTTRTRYGQDYYDERMQAATRYSVADTTSKTLRLERRESSQINVTASKVNGNVTSEATNAKNHEESAQDLNGESAPDPIKWFGILVPPQLRSCQKSFLDMATGPIIDAINASRSLREVETNIRKTRKDIRKAERATAS
ncbi:hypothetical protein BDZ85DRAFT_280506 [Elsinoe ampelina]|uniref:Vacuolar ATPase assembly protein VMA22 n=1 Tax=Elsinoe ampelina TaxID=302913 RepID=A0A6A6GIN1_9PEZI|nr:hypothetical protein BDZ85DRAFT_280506 [Elsinoe ampelina]